MMVTSGLLSFAVRWRTVLRAFHGLTSVVRRTATSDPLEHVEVPGWWFVAGTTVSGEFCVILGQRYFGISWWMGIVAVLFTFVLSIVAARPRAKRISRRSARWVKSRSCFTAGWRPRT